MEPPRTTTLRVSIELRDEIARLAEGRGSSMVDVVTEAIRHLQADEWWGSVHRSLDDMSDDEVAAHRSETDRFGGVAADGLG